MTTNLVEKAFELAQTGEYSNLKELQKALKRSGFWGSEIEAHLIGGTMKRSLRSALKAAQTDRPDTPSDAA